MRTFINILDAVLARVSVFLMTALVFTVLFQVFMRFVVQSPVTFTEELSRFLLIWLGLFASSYAYRLRLHLALDLLLLKLQGGRRKALNVVIHSLIGLFSLTVLVYGGAQLVWLTYILQQYSAALGVSMSVVYSVLPISGLAITIYAADFILQELGLIEADHVPARQAVTEQITE